MGFSSSSSQLPDYHDFLLNYVESRMPKRLRRHVGVSDIVQSVFCVAGIKLTQFRGSTDLEFRGWLIRIAERKMLDAMRRHRQRELPPEVQPIVSVIAEDSVDPLTPDELVSDHERVTALVEAIERLPGELRSVFVARHVRGLTFEEAASELSLAVSTCRRRWLEGLEHLSIQLERHA